MRGPAVCASSWRAEHGNGQSHMMPGEHVARGAQGRGHGQAPQRARAAGLLAPLILANRLCAQGAFLAGDGRMKSATEDFHPCDRTPSSEGGHGARGSPEALPQAGRAAAWNFRSDLCAALILSGPCPARSGPPTSCPQHVPERGWGVSSRPSSGASSPGCVAGKAAGGRGGRAALERQSPRALGELCPAPGPPKAARV